MALDVTIRAGTTLDVTIGEWADFAAISYCPRCEREVSILGTSGMCPLCFGQTLSPIADVEPQLILPDAMNPCGKRWFLTAREPREEIRHMKPRKPNSVLNSYYCYPCDGYHIGHTELR